MNQLTQEVRSLKKSTSHRGRNILLLVLFLVVGYYGILSLGVYTGAWSGSKTQRVLTYTPLPIAWVGWRPISLATFLNERAAINHYNAYLKTSTADIYQQPTEDSSVTALTKIIRETATERVAKKLGVSITTSDVTQAYQTQLLQNGNADQVSSAIRDYYGWSPEEFQTRVIKPAVLRNKLQEKLSFDEKLSAPAKQQADKVLAIVRDGKQSFSEIATKYSDDVYGAKGGDLGFVTQGEQDQEIDNAAFSLELNTVSDLIHTKYGYHIIKPTERKTVDGQEQVHVYIISFLAPQVDQYLNTELKTMRIQVMYPSLHWDASAFRVSTSDTATAQTSNTTNVPSNQ